MLITAAQWISVLGLLAGVAAAVPSPLQRLADRAAWVCVGLVAACLLGDAAL